MSRRTREQSSHDTREALLRAGLALFAEQGVDKPSLDTICERAGFTRGAFYVHFPSRDAFLVAVLDRVLQAWLELIVDSADTGGDLMRSISRFVQASGAGGASPFLAERAQLRVLIEGIERSPEVRARYAEVVSGAVVRLTSLVAAAQGSGAVRADVPAPEVAQLLVTLVLGTLAAEQTGLPSTTPALASLLFGLLRA